MIQRAKAQNSVKCDGDALMKVLLPASDSARALADLDAMGVDHARVYPEREGAAQRALFRTVAKHTAFVTRDTSRPS